MSEAVKKALEVAKKAALRHEIETRIKRGDTLWKGIKPEEVEETVANCWDAYQQWRAWQEYVDGSAAAIAAFLRALGQGSVVGEMCSPATGIITLHRLAAAVEQEARDAG